MTFLKQDDRLDKLGKDILEKTFKEFPALARDRIALTWIVYDNPVIVNTGGAISFEEFWQYQVRGFNYRGMERMYPASIVKLFYLVAIQEWLEREMIGGSLELDRAIRDAIVDSSDDATSLILDVLSGTTSGPELPPGPFETWKQQRNIVNRYYQNLAWPELENINLNQKTWCDGAYGRERAFLGELRENSNMLTTLSVAKLLHTIIGGVAVSSPRSQFMMGLLKRSLSPKNLADNEGENQIRGFLGAGVPTNAKLWSKAGWTSRVRHDAAYIEIPNLQPYLLVVFTEGLKVEAGKKDVIPFISKAFVNAMGDIS
ncbi:MAG: serine hydrolase [Prochloraceae cyanobacterium]